MIVGDYQSQTERPKSWEKEKKQKSRLTEESTSQNPPAKSLRHPKRIAYTTTEAEVQSSFFATGHPTKSLDADGHVEPSLQH